MKEQWKETMRRKLGDYEQSAPELSWTDIERAVKERKTSSARARVVPLWVKGAVSAAAIALIVIAISMLLPRKNAPSVANIAKRHKVINTNTATNNIVASNPKATLVAYEAVRQYAKGVYNTNAKDVNGEIMLLSLQAERSNPTMQDESESSNNMTAQTSRGENNYLAQTSSRQNKSTNRLTAKVYLANAMTGNGNTGTSGIALASADPIGYFDETLNSSTSDVLSMQASDVKTTTKYRQPIRLGVRVKYDLNSRWSVESGVTYSYLSSTTSKKVGNASYDTGQKLNYVGIPLNLDYTIWGDEHFKVYVSGGGMAEKMVSGRSTTTYSLDGQQMSTTREKVSIRPLQWSVNGGAGIEYSPKSGFGIYAEPGVNYYFKSQDKVPTIYNDKPFNINLNVGIRITIK